jgi:FkbM family methyltransferase
MNNINSISDINLYQDVWQTLAAADKPIVIYGMGNGADKILGVFDKKGIKVAEFFASDAFVRGQSFHGKTVLSYSQVCEKYDDFIIVVAFGTRLPEVMELIYRLEKERELYIPDVPVAGEEIFDIDYFNLHKGDLETAFSLLSDDLSRRTFLDMLIFKLTGKLDFLKHHTVSPEEVFTKILSACSYRETADLGAYNGDSIRELSQYSPNLKRVTALEPDLRSFRKLTDYANSVTLNITAHNVAAWSNECDLEFTSSGNRNSTLSSDVGLKTGAKIKITKAARLDSLYEGNCDFIKYDVEGAEYEALLGSRQIIYRERPELLVSLYHRSEDLFRIPLLLHDMGYSHLYIRRYEYIPAWDLNLLAIK